MDILMTHEQADFDAIASLLTAALLQEDAFALLPRKINRNVKAFLELYGGEFPFFNYEDLPQGKIDHLTLVDTQSLVTIKGLSKTTKIQVIDHHPKKDKFPENWSLSFHATGACTTILVEDFRAHHGQLNILQATLLLLGIYEDTGSLSYAHTTPRDALAVAYLLENGASLKIANQYLNPPLSNEQEIIYQRLMENVSYHEIHGTRILLSTADASDKNVEISSIAHKIRDLLDPDALFFIVKTNEGIRLIARSSHDRVPVNQVAEIFSGGGHARAAAALSPYDKQDVTIKSFCKELMDVLPKIIEPSVSVQQIMSKNPLTITPETTVQKAASLMQRYGFEGYPVVKNDQIVGLLTRRAVDRAISHKLNKKTASLMKAGNYYVHTVDSLQKLQHVMTVSGWGQVPVLHPDSEKIVGIVTRTDLINALGKPVTSMPGKKNLTTLLNKSLPPGRIAFLQFIAAIAAEQNMPIYVVGGFVRDLLLNRPSLDFDIVVEGDAIALGKTIQENYGGKLHTHKRFGTAKWDIENLKPEFLDKLHFLTPDQMKEVPSSLDLITARTEFYEFPTALPKIEKSSIKLDLHRRDFSINTLALRLDGRHYGELYDYWGGLEDIQNGTIRVLHSLSFIDDPTRLIRAVRFEQRFDFSIEHRTLQLMDEALEMLSQVSGDRLRHELNLILLEKNPKPALLRLQSLNLLNNIHEGFFVNEQIADMIVKAIHSPPPEKWEITIFNGNMPIQLTLAYIIWFSFISDTPESICKRLRTSALILESTVKVKVLQTELTQYSNKPISEIFEFLSGFPKIVLYSLYLLTMNQENRQILYRYFEIWQFIKPEITGDELKNMGIKPGPHFKTILNLLRGAWLDGKIHSLEEELKIVHDFIDQNPELKNDPLHTT
jgi:tRNA nucleotidyltransferase (CCA-adding enzyme)